MALPVTAYPQIPAGPKWRPGPRPRRIVGVAALRPCIQHTGMGSTSTDRRQCRAHDDVLRPGHPAVDVGDGLRRQLDKGPEKQPELPQAQRPAVNPVRPLDSAFPGPAESLTIRDSAHPGDRNPAGVQPFERPDVYRQDADLP